MRTRSLMLVLLAVPAFGGSGCGTDEQAAPVGVVTLAPGVTLFADTLPACRRCSLELREIGRFGAADDSVLLRGIPVVVRDGRGFVHAAVPFATDQEILRFAPDGSLAGTVGRHGTGPGEYRYVNALSLHADTILVVAHDDRHITEFTTGGHHLRTLTVSPRLTGTAVKLRGGGFVMTGRLRAANHDERPIHFLSDAGVVERSAGTDDVLSARGGRRRALGRVEDDGFWIAEIGTYRLERLDLNGEVTRTLGVSAPPSFYSLTFMSREAAEEARRQARVTNRSELMAARPATLPAPPIFRVAGLGVLDDMLVVVANVPAAGWDTIQVAYASGGEVALEDGVYPRIYATVVDVVDPATGTLLARTRLPGYGALASDSVIATLHADEYGVITGRLFRVRFRRR